MPVHPSAHNDLYPATEPRASGFLKLDDRHMMYWEEAGNPRGTPILFLHGGPGAGCTADHRRFFDPQFYRIILYDQRGAGRSTPLGEIRNNTTQLLIEDIERLRRFLDVERWFLFGGSWGSTLALAYGEAHPDCCLGFILRGIFLGRRDEVDWFLYGMQRFFPEAWRAFSGHIPEAERTDLLTAFHRRLTNPDPLVHQPAARVWSSYEGSCSSLQPNSVPVKHFASDQVALGLARIEAHYFVNEIFLADNALLAGIDKIRRLPCVIVQGRYDMVCPIRTADELARAWPEARYEVIPQAGHSAWEPGILSALLEATRRFKASVEARPGAITVRA
jgi:proline iminopeptidase